MRYLLLSDIHGNQSALEAVLADAGRIDGVWCAGDLVDYGTEPHAVVQWFRTHAVQCVSGNHDRHLLNILHTGEAETLRGTNGWKWVHDNCERVTAEDIGYLQSRPMHISFAADGAAYLMQHQMQEGPLAYRLPQSVQEFDAFWAQWYDGPPAEGMERRMIFGHTHRRCAHRLDNDRLWLNPGSASYRRPDDQDKRAHYMIIDKGQVTFHAVAYDRSRSLERALAYLREGCMMETELQDAMFFFGDAATSREPLPKAKIDREKVAYEGFFDFKGRLAAHRRAGNDSARRYARGQNLHSGSAHSKGRGNFSAA